LNYDAAIRQTTDGRPVDALIAAYAAKTLGAPLGALVAAHLELKPDNRAYVAALEAAHGVFLEELRPVPLAGRDRRLVNIFAAPDSSPRPAAPEAFVGSSHMLPRALRPWAGCDRDLRWRSCGAGVKEARLARADETVRLVSVRPGKRLPIAPAQGLTTALVLAGCASDGRRDHVRGDIIFVGDGSPAQPFAKGDEDCVCFAVDEPPVTAQGPFRRVLQRLTGG
jgi:putative transcriptional regulator